MNVADAERTVRMAIGWTSGFVGLVLIAAEGNAGRVAVGAALAVVGWTVFLTGHLGRCPVYRRLGHTSRSEGQADVGGTRGAAVDPPAHDQRHAARRRRPRTPDVSSTAEGHTAGSAQPGSG